MAILKMKRAKEKSPSPLLTLNIKDSDCKSIEKIEDEFEVLKCLAEGCFARVLLVKKGGEKLVLKAIHSEVSNFEDFKRELSYNYFLSPHPNIVKSYNVTFWFDNCFVFVQEFCPYGDLSRFVKKGGLPENQVKTIAHQLASAIEFLHTNQLVHRDLKLENILVSKKPAFEENFLIKVCDFGLTRKKGTLVTKTNQTWIPFAPPEICQLLLYEKYYCETWQDVWQVGIIIFVLVTGFAPFQVADITDVNYCQYTKWIRKKSLKTPQQFKPFTPRLLRLFRRLLEPKPTLRSEIREVYKYTSSKDIWVTRGGSGSAMNGVERRESTSTRFSQKNPPINRQSHRSSANAEQQTRRTRQLSLKVLKSYGLTDINKNSVSERVSDWVQTTTNTKPSICCTNNL